MSRRVATTLTISLQLRQPPGTSGKSVLHLITRALLDHKLRMNKTEPLAAIDLDSLILRVTKRETTYL